MIAIMFFRKRIEQYFEEFLKIKRIDELEKK